MGCLGNVRRQGAAGDQNAPPQQAAHAQDAPTKPATARQQQAQKNNYFVQLTANEIVSARTRSKYEAIISLVQFSIVTAIYIPLLAVGMHGVYACTRTRAFQHVLPYLWL